MERHCSGPLCTPARASLLTGRHHLKTRAIDTYCGRSILDPGETTLGHLFSDAGYHTAAFGKWHLGDCYPSRAIDLGFKETLTHGAGGIGQPGDHPENHSRWKTDSYFDPVLSENGEPVQKTGYCTDIFTNAAIETISRCDDSYEPFFIYLSSPTPHSPCIVGEEWSKRFVSLGLPDPQPKLYGMVENIDWNVGRVLRCLKDRALDENTLVIFTSDHGPCGSAAVFHPDGSTTHRWNAGLRGIKGTLYEGGIRVPSIWRWPKKIAAGRSIKSVTSPMDVLPTFQDWFAPSFSGNKAIDGVSLTSHLERTDQQEPPALRDHLIMQWHRGDEPICSRNAAVITDRFKWYSRDEGGAAELYDLKTDSSEKFDLALEEPQVAAKLREVYEKWFFELCHEVGRRGFDSPEIVLGSRKEPQTLLTQNDWLPIGNEGWCTDDLRGFWKVRFERSGRYRFRLRFREKAPAGVDRIVLGSEDRTLSRADTMTEIDVETDQILPLETWRELDHPLNSARNRSSLAALYVEVERVD